MSQTRVAAGWAFLTAAMTLGALTVPAGASASVANLVKLVAPAYKCVGNQVKIFDNWNVYGVSNGGTAPTFSTTGQSYCVESISDYHWDNAHGGAVGTIGMSTVSGLGGPGNTFGPWPAVGSSGQAGARNVNWNVSITSPQNVVINGTYACKDSIPATWSQDQASKGHGFCDVLGQRAQRFTPPPPPPPTYKCTGPQIKLFDNWNGFGVSNGGKPPAFTTKGQTYCVQSISDYHWNDGHGQKPGTIGLTDLFVNPFGAAALGPWPATGSGGQGGAANVNWTANVPAAKPAVINGDYTCRDSSPATWSQDQASFGRGFCQVYVTKAVLTVGGTPVPPPAGPPPPASPAHPTCTPTPPSTYLIYPNHVAPGSVTSFLLWCQEPVALGFTGAFAPLQVLIYDWYSYQDQHFVNGYLQPNSATSVVRPPAVPAFTVIGPHDIDVTLPATMRPGLYIPIVVYAKGEVPSMNALNVP